MDEWQHHQRGNQAGPGVDAQSGHCRVPEFRCGLVHAAGGGSPPGIHDLGVEGCVQIRHDSCRSVGPGRGHCGLTRLERIGWSMGASCRRHEEVCVERDSCRGRQAVHGRAGSSPNEHGAVSKHEQFWPAIGARSDCARAAVLCGFGGRCLSQTGGRCAVRDAASEDYIERRFTRFCSAYRRRPGKDHKAADPGCRGELVDPI